MAANQGNQIFNSIFGSTFESDSSGIGKDICLDVFGCDSYGGEGLYGGGGGGGTSLSEKENEYQKKMLEYLSNRIKTALNPEPVNTLNSFGNIRAINDGASQIQFTNIVPNNNKYKIVKNGRIRSTPSVKSDSNVIKTYSTGGTIFTAQEQGVSGDKIWYYGVDQNGNQGYVREDAANIFVQNTPTPTTTGGIDLNNLGGTPKKSTKPLLTDKQKSMIMPIAVGGLALGTIYLLFFKK